MFSLLFSRKTEHGSGSFRTLCSPVQKYLSKQVNRDVAIKYALMAKRERRISWNGYLFRIQEQNQSREKLLHHLFENNRLQDLMVPGALILQGIRRNQIPRWRSRYVRCTLLFIIKLVTLAFVGCCRQYAYLAQKIVWIYPTTLFVSLCTMRIKRSHLPLTRMQCSWKMLLRYLKIVRESVSERCAEWSFLPKESPETPKVNALPRDFVFGGCICSYLAPKATRGYNLG